LCLAEQLARAADNIADDIATSLAAFEAKEAAEAGEEAVLSRSSSTKALSFSFLRGLLRLLGGGGPHGIHLHGPPGLFNGGGCGVVRHVKGGGVIGRGRYSTWALQN